MSVAALRVDAQIAGISGTLVYTGDLGPVNSERPLCLCAYRNANLSEPFGCYIYFAATASYQIYTFDTEDYFLIAFVDVQRNERVDADEPFEIYHNRATPPGDPITAGVGVSGIDIVFGDENLPGAPTPSPTATPTDMAPVTRTPTPTAARCAADCDHSGSVTIGDVITLEIRALGNVNFSSCAIADSDGNGSIEVDEIVAAVNSAIAGCPGAP